MKCLLWESQSTVCDDVFRTVTPQFPFEKGRTWYVEGSISSIRAMRINSRKSLPSAWFNQMVDSVESESLIRFRTQRHIRVISDSSGSIRLTLCSRPLRVGSSRGKCNFGEVLGGKMNVIICPLQLSLTTFCKPEVRSGHGKSLKLILRSASLEFKVRKFPGVRVRQPGFGVKILQYEKN